jgi:hypothetical protein
MERRKVVAREIPATRPELPQELLEPVSYSNTMAEYRSLLTRRFKRRRVARLVYNGFISVLSLRIPELKHLKVEVRMKKKSEELFKKYLEAEGRMKWVFGVGCLLSFAVAVFDPELVPVVVGMVFGIEAFLKHYESKL